MNSTSAQAVSSLILAALVLIFSAVHGYALDLVKNGRPAATILLPKEVHASEQKAAEALVKYLKAASGAELKIVKEPHLPEGAIVSIGQTQAAARAGVTAESLPWDGYRIVVKSGTLYLLGRDLPRTPKMSAVMGAQGTWRAALGLLERIGFRWIQPTEQGFHAPTLKTVSVPDDLAVTFNPPFIFGIGRMIGLGDWSMANGFRCAVNLYTEGGHTWCTFVPAKHWESHPDYFQMRGGKRIKPEGDGYFLCPSNPEVQRLLAEGIRKKFDEGYEWVQLGQSDGYRPCECDACKALDRPGEVHEQVQIPHHNVIRMVQETHPDRKVHMMVYGPTVQPSARIDRYSPNVIGEVGINWTLAQAFVGKENFSRERLVAGHEAALRAWSERIPSGLTAYVYYFGTYHNLGLAPKLSPRMVAEEIRRLHKFNVRGIYFCGGGENWGAEGPSYYVAARLMNDPSLDCEPLVEEYCRLTFGPAAGTMRAYYDRLYRQIEHGPFAAPSGMLRFMALYPLTVLDELDGLLAKANDEASSDARARGWLRLVQISHRHLSLIARTYHAYDRYQEEPTQEVFEKIKRLVLDYRGLVDEVRNMNKKEAAFVRDYFPGWGHWHQDVEANGGMGGRNLGVPFTWDFESLAKGGSLPGGVCNPGFESTDIERTRPSDWHVFPANTHNNFLDNQTVHGGKTSLHFSLAPIEGKAADYVVYQHVPRRYKTGQWFRFSCYVKTRDLKGSAHIGVMRYPVVPDDRRVIPSEHRLRGTQDWTLLSVVFPVREGMSETSIRCHVGGTAGEAWFDDATFEEVREERGRK